MYVLRAHVLFPELDYSQIAVFNLHWFTLANLITINKLSPNFGLQFGTPAAIKVIVYTIVSLHDRLKEQNHKLLVQPPF